MTKQYDRQLQSEHGKKLKNVQIDAWIIDSLHSAVVVGYLSSWDGACNSRMKKKYIK